MDFIKTSSLRALIELTFQRNWNGLIWMSRKGVTTKRVKTVQTALSRISAQTAQSGWPRITSVRLKSRPKFQNRRPITHHDPGNMSRGRPRHNLTPHRARPKPREPGNKPRGRATVSRTTADAPSEPGNYVPRPAENSSAKSSSVRPRGRPRIHPATTVPISDPDPISGRSSRPTVPTPRSTRSPF
ncbi:unnamed protein product [Microthlaspi erraticum]|uniref:Uncharacterized protein n=1 Tax=Microthlaspi erraticum TaxID=1685480 RepID=A0A6D2JEY0_9BRAS|nr:unnamed protein product [Microthlaspi erraticum]